MKILRFFFKGNVLKHRTIASNKKANTNTEHPTPDACIISEIYLILSIDFQTSLEESVINTLMAVMTPMSL